MIAAVLCGITAPGSVPRSICALGHKWMWNRALGGLPPEDFLGAVDPLLSGIRAQLTGRYETSDKVAGALTPEWAARLGLRSDMPIPVGAFDAHCDAIGAGACTGDVGNVVGTSTCIIAMSEDTRLIPGVCGVVPASVHPNKTEVEAGLFVTLGWNLSHSAQDELFAAIEGTAFHTRVIFLERMEQHSVPIRRVINAGGIPQKNEVLNRIYANVLSKPVLIPQSEVTSLGSAIFASLAAGLFRRSKRPRMRCARSTVWSSPTPRPPESTKSFMGCIGSCILVWA
jgi:L-ribulokinase